MSSVASLLADAPAVQHTILAAAAAARRLPGADLRAMTHSWLFSGPPGAGRSNAALAFAAAVMCTQQPGVGCGACESCVGILEHHRHTDLVFVKPEELSIGVDRVRDVISDAAKRPTVAPWRFIIFDNADRLSDGAANALLKTVEEPTASTVLVLCAPSAAPEDFSQTLRSRCRHLYIPTPSAAKVVETLVAEGYGEEAAKLAAAASARHIGRARHLVADAGAQQRRAQVLNLAEAVFGGSGGFAAAGALVKAIEKEAKDDGAERDDAERAKVELAYGAGARGKGTAKAQRDVKSAIKELEGVQKKRATRRLRDALDMALVDLAGLYRDALMQKVGATVELTHPDFAGLSGELASRVGEEGLVACIDATQVCREHLGFNVAPATAFDGLVGRLRLACGVR